MKVNWSRGFTDDELRRLSAVLRPSNRISQRKAQRTEVRIWLDGLVKKALTDLPAVRQRITKPENVISVPAYEHVSTESCPHCAVRGCEGECRTGCTCGKPKAEHFGARMNCPLSKHVKPGARFTPAES